MRMSHGPVRLIAVLLGLSAGFRAAGTGGPKAPAPCSTVVGVLATDFINAIPNPEFARVEVRQCSPEEGYRLQLVAWPSGESPRPLVVDTPAAAIAQMTAWENIFYIEMPGPGAPIYVIGYDEGIPKLLLHGISRGDSEVKETDHGLDLQFRKFSTGGPPWHPAHYHFELNEEGMVLPKGTQGPERTPSNLPMIVPSAKSPGEVPVPMKTLSLEYPRFAAVARITGTALLRVRVDKEGTVSEAHGISGPSLLVYAALDNIKLWRFAPAGAGAPAVETEFEWQYVFELKGEADERHWSSETTYEYPNKVTVMAKVLLLHSGGIEHAER